MRRAFTSSLFVIAFLLIAIGCGSGGDLAKPETQREFGVRMAKMNLWREATFRFRREVQITPDNAMAHSNLAVALEAIGDFDAAAKEYREALRLDRSNQYIQKNYSRFIEFTQKAKKRDATAVKAAATADKTGVGTPVMTGTTGTVPGVHPPPQPPDVSLPPTPPPTNTNPPDGGPR
jgi:tetratricopeptide (TPR) repeat protein